MLIFKCDKCDGGFFERKDRNENKVDEHLIENVFFECDLCGNTCDDIKVSFEKIPFYENDEIIISNIEYIR